MANNNEIISSSMLLFVDQLLVAATGWLFWLVVSKIALASEIGQATSVYSLVLLASTIAQLGLEYPLLKNAPIDRNRTIGTTLLVEMMITVSMIPFIIVYFLNIGNDKSLQQYTWLAVVMFILYSTAFVARYALIGISDVRALLIIDAVATGLKFVIAYALLYNGYGALGLIISFVAQLLTTGALALAKGSRSFKFSFGGTEYLKEIVKAGLVNTPAKLSRMLIVSLSIVLLASSGISSSDIGVFYVVLMISIMAGSLVTSIAYMVIPASSVSKTDLSSGTIRLGLSLTAPIIAALIVAPTFVLSLVGSSYTVASPALLVLSISIMPSSIVTSAISKFNNLNDARKLVFIGVTQVTSFLITFYIFVPLFGILGASLSILVAFLASTVSVVIWSDRLVIKYIANSCLAIAVGVAAGYILRNQFDLHPFAIILISMVVVMTVILLRRNTTVTEIKQLLKAVTKKSRN